MTKILICNISHVLKYSDFCSSYTAMAKMHFFLTWQTVQNISVIYKRVASSIKVAQSRQHLVTK